MPRSEICREPSAEKIFYGIGRKYTTGLVVGSVIYFLEGMYESPNGKRFISGTQTVRMNAAQFAGGVVFYSCLFNTFKYTMVSLRQKVDQWNAIVAGAATFASGSMRWGVGYASRMALFGGVAVAAMFKGAEITMGLRENQ